MSSAEEAKVSDLTEAQARAELDRLAEALTRANRAYHTEDAPEISDADYDAMKRRNAEIEARFPGLKIEDSPSDQVGGALAEGFAKVRHAVRMLSLANAFEDGDILAPTAPGLGVELHEEACARYPYAAQDIPLFDGTINVRGISKGASVVSQDGA